MVGRHQHGFPHHNWSASMCWQSSIAARETRQLRADAADPLHVGWPSNGWACFAGTADKTFVVSSFGELYCGKVASFW